MFFSLSPGSRPIRGLAGEKLEGEVKRNASQTDTRHGADFERLALRHRASVSLHNCFMLLFLCALVLPVVHLHSQLHLVFFLIFVSSVVPA